MSEFDDTSHFLPARQEVIALLRNYRWSGSALGSPLRWPDRLKHLVELILNTPVPSFILYGVDRRILYNGAFSRFCDDRHPEAFGAPFSIAFPEASEALAYYEEAFCGTPVIARNLPWPGNRGGQPFAWTVDLELTPVTDEHLNVAWLKAKIANARAPQEPIHLHTAERRSKSVHAARPIGALDDDRTRLDLALSAAQLTLWDWHIKGNEIIWSGEHFRVEGYGVAEARPGFETWQAQIHPDDLAHMLTALDSAKKTGEPYNCDFRFLYPDGKMLWSHATGRFFYNDEGEAIRMIGVMHDITQQREQIERQQILITEMQHRTRNLIGLIQVLVRRTIERATSLEDFSERLSPRLNALSRVQSFIAQIESGSIVTFDELLRAELAALGAIDEDGRSHNVTMDGPRDVLLRSNMVQTFALALHELATNATKYGALQNDGHLLVTWRVEQATAGSAQMLYVDWRESGVVMPSIEATQNRKGYGRELIERALPYQLNADTAYAVHPDGISCQIALPISSGGQTHSQL